MKAVLRYLDKSDPGAARIARERYACFDRFGGLLSDLAGRNMREAEQASKVSMRMPILRPFGEGSTGGEAIDARTCLIRRGSGHGTLERWFVVIGGDPPEARVAASTPL